MKGWVERPNPCLFNDMKKFDWKALSLATKIQLIASGVLVLVVVGLLVWAIGFGGGQGSEAGFMKVCWNSDGTANFDDRACSDPEEIVWETDRLPLLVSAGRSHAREIREAILEVNDAAGCEVLRFPTIDAPIFDVAVNTDVPQVAGGPQLGGGTGFRRTIYDRHIAVVNIYAGSLEDPSIGIKVLMHEFGHVLGLAHDEWSGSIMRLGQRSGIEFVRFSDHDRGLLHARYCRAPR